MVQLQTPLTDKDIAPDINPNALQEMASNPLQSVWVGASAGSGKTKVLTDRMLRLLLPGNHGEPATPPHKILALTFTKAGASEMALRVGKRLSDWVVMPEESDDPEKEENGLKGNLRKLLGRDATAEQISAARKLFASVIDAPGGMKIMTIHSFCQSLLSQFPLEADLPPQFQALEEAQAKKILKQSIQDVLSRSEVEKGTPLNNAVRHIASLQNEDQFSKLLNNLVGERQQLQKIIQENFGIQGLYTALCKDFGITPGETAEQIIYQACDSSKFDEQGLREACTVLQQVKGKTDNKHGLIIQQWLDANKDKKVMLYDLYKTAFLKKDNSAAFEKLASVDAVKKFPSISNILKIEADRLLKIVEAVKAINIVTSTRDLFLIGHEILEQYKQIKEEQSLLDFDDLIIKTLQLLQGNTVNMEGLKPAPWVRYKLDQGIDHILVDEAQDTNPEQWEIIKAITDDFFSGDSGANNERTMFVVGDEKQSIFSFQRASPKKFHEMRLWFESKIKNAMKKFEPVDFTTSFRSVTAVLELVDAVFENEMVQKGVSKQTIHHESYRIAQPGLVEIWPLFKNPKKDDYDPWAPPIKVIEATNSAAQMAEHVGNTIQGWIDNKEPLESHGRPIKPGDIMILVRSRTAFLDQLVRALKTRQIPVSGVDRMILGDQLVVQDLCAAAQFALLPEDDLNLAGFLKSPFIGWNEEQLFSLSHNRKGSLWQALLQTDNTSVIDFLNKLITRAGSQRPYDFFGHLLQEPCPKNSKSGLHAIKERLGEESLDPLDEFLNAAMAFEYDNLPTLQNFIQTRLYDDDQIKREMEEAGNMVRIMTVHGAKGLQAPIVILPDTVRNSNTVKPETLLWPEKTGAALPIFCPNKDVAPSSCIKIRNDLKQTNDEEYRRLMYVAMTRAENRLYIGGYETEKNTIDDSWYCYIKDGFRTLLDHHNEPYNEDEIMTYRHGNEELKPDRQKETNPKTSQSNDVLTPEWLFKTMPEEDTPPRPLRPSRPSEAEAAVLSPLKADDNYRFLRGNITHKLLQLLPDIPADQWQASAEKYVAQQGQRLPQGTRKETVREALNILQNPEFSAIFEPGSIAEVPITGFTDGKSVVSGQIDRLLVTPEEVLIIDYKSNRPPPLDDKDIPVIYVNQMRAYANILRGIYKNRRIRTAIIWTDGPRLTELKGL